MGLHIVHIKLEDGSPEGLQIQVNRWMEPAEGDYVNVKINMHKQPDQDGHCGNFNGVPTDDDRIQVRARVGKTGVEPAQMLFHTKTPVMAASGPSHPWTVSLMCALEVKVLLRQVRNCTV